MGYFINGSGLTIYMDEKIKLNPYITPYKISCRSIKEDFIWKVKVKKKVKGKYLLGSQVRENILSISVKRLS